VPLSIHGRDARATFDSRVGRPVPRWIVKNDFQILPIGRRGDGRLGVNLITPLKTLWKLICYFFADSCSMSGFRQRSDVQL
jgi:hypothetical protein